MSRLCFDCHLSTVDKLVKKFNLSAVERDKLLHDARELLQKYSGCPNPIIATYIQRLASQKIKCDALYREEKCHANTVLLSDYQYWEIFVNQSHNPFQTAVKLAVAGNIIDYGAHSQPEDITAKINELVKLKFAIDDTINLYNRIKAAKKILYLGDNAGEIVFDKLLLETINHPNVVFAVRGRPVINDATIDDAMFVGMDKLCKVITNGYDAPSTLLEHCSQDFVAEYKEADLIISKGQGNFEGLMNSGGSNIVFMLMAKCNPIAELLGVKKGSLIVKENIKQKVV
ncbi:damage-control phosphatase ARMT1 family protein [Plebeiibacterium marinum]|uniref:ARMT1-like domain-containing protein n=1 Tax=Plebeiibacterium marinum TaxID=2992111 RepID=A0AAE3MH70_9BACT|nr:ARMT1-like domain-containing protein [Plebeiobacterium marinum]MCW3807597.1 ARMT1-like domain-containing protein [Plebeiobacterium marinum]